MGSVILPFEGNVYFGAIVGFVATLAVASLLDRFGDDMFRRGVAMPFFLGRHRLHHRQFLFGYLHILWSLFWTGILGTVALTAGCLVFDLAIDRFQMEGRWGFLHHELVYLAVPAYAFTAFLRLVI